MATEDKKEKEEKEGKRQGGRSSRGAGDSRKRCLRPAPAVLPESSSSDGGRLDLRINKITAKQASF